MVEYLQRTKAKSVNSILFSRDSYRIRIRNLQSIDVSILSVEILCKFLLANFFKQPIYIHIDERTYVSPPNENRKHPRGN